MGFAERGDAVARPFLLRWLLIPLVLAGATLGLSEGSDIDRALTRLVFDPVSEGFPLRTSFLLDVVMHHWAKYAVVTIGSLVAGCYALSFLLPALRRTRRILLYLVLALTLAPLSVTLAKAANNRHCPWDVEEFGGLVPYTGLFGPLAPGIEPGRCFPAGHAATGFALMAFYFAAYALGRRRAARLALSFAIAAGLVLGAGRVLQGAHFASHVIWSGILCWTVMVALYALLLAGGTAVLHASSRPTTRLLLQHASQATMKASKRSRSGHTTRTLRSAFAATGWCRWTARGKQSAMHRAVPLRVPSQAPETVI